MKFTAVWANGAVVELEADGFSVTMAADGATVREVAPMWAGWRDVRPGDGPPAPGKTAYMRRMCFDVPAPDGERMRCAIYVEEGAPDSAIIAGASMAMSREYPRHALHIASEAPGWLKAPKARWVDRDEGPGTWGYADGAAVMQGFGVTARAWADRWRVEEDGKALAGGDVTPAPDGSVKAAMDAAEWWIHQARGTAGPGVRAMASAIRSRGRGPEPTPSYPAAS